MTRPLTVLIVLAGCVAPRSPSLSQPRICRYEVLRTPTGCSVVEKTWRVAADGVAEFDDSADHDLALGATRLACTTPVTCTDAPVPTRSECGGEAKVALFSWDGGACRFLVGRPVWGVCAVSSYCSKPGGLTEGVLYVPEGFAGRVGSETLWCGCR